ncbi:hypothetical protein GCK72_014290 [Caenorhabditis remanei]|uniref:poly(A)-specific ribonuclease n=1 Tax=Caenorhabditis remanei TaxID=31234 RepID=A0A2P4W875_CAERE|nr:hypothetical protein GCK72_014290 [Caenorhabditis remanei]KAF1757833.1 hypothetical protein GCK72_014290 [Caenorhabditis remanei]
MADSGEGESPSRRNSSGKRFVRRARRWAELQQKRQGRRNCEDPDVPVGQNETKFHMHHPSLAFLNSQHSKDQKYRPPEPPHVYDYVEMAAFGSGEMVVDDELNYDIVAHEENQLKQNLGHTRSFPITILQPRTHEIQMPTGFPVSYGYTDHRPCQRATSNAYFYPSYLESSCPHYQSSLSSFEQRQVRPISMMKSVDSALTLITNDLSTISISDASNTSPSSISNNSEEDIFSSAYKFASSLPKSSNFTIPVTIPHNFFVNTHPPPERNWVMIRHADPERPIATFTVLCYNVLCDKYATVNQYSYCPSWALNWEYRKTLIIKEIRTYEADVITLQEVETEQFRTLFLPELKALGYTGIFAAKTRAKTMSEEEKKYVDGCAIFWKVDKFDMDKQQVFEFSAVAMKKASSSGNILNRVMPRDNIALCAVLKIKDAVYANRRMTIPANDNVVGNPLVVCTAHVHWDPEFCDVKLVQTMLLANEVSRLLDEVSKSYKITQQQVPVLICGDLNSLPESGVFEYLSKGQISRSHADFKSFRDDTCLEMFSNSTDKNVISHPLRLDSACDITSIPFTNYTLDFKGMIDYIFATPQSLARLGILGPFDPQWVQSNKILGFPHPHVASDHIPIMAQYAIIPTTHQRQPPPPQQTGHPPPVGVIGGGYPAPPQHSFLR